MASTRNLNTCIFFLSVIFVTLVQQVPFSEGRKMKFVKEKGVMQTPNDVVDHHHPATLSSSIPDDFSPTNPGRSPGVGHKANNQKVQTLSSSTPDDFSPTNPGRSPGVGHSKHSADDLVSTNLGRSPGIGHKNIGISYRDNKQIMHNTPNSLYHPAPAHTLSSSPDDFKPTNPGRSPGVGHSLQTMKNKPNE